MKLKSSAKNGFTLLEIMIVCSLIGTLAAIAIPNFVRARQGSQVNVCINNLRQIQSAIQVWAIESNNGAKSAVTETDVTPYLKNEPVCPAGGKKFSDSYALTDVSTDPSCQKAATSHVLGQ